MKRTELVALVVGLATGFLPGWDGRANAEPEQRPSRGRPKGTQNSSKLESKGSSEDDIAVEKKEPIPVPLFNGDLGGSPSKKFTTKPAVRVEGVIEQIDPDGGVLISQPYEKNHEEALLRMGFHRPMDGDPPADGSLHNGRKYRRFLLSDKGPDFSRLDLLRGKEVTLELQQLETGEHAVVGVFHTATP